MGRLSGSIGAFSILSLWMVTFLLTTHATAATNEYGLNLNFKLDLNPYLAKRQTTARTITSTNGRCGQAMNGVLMNCVGSDYGDCCNNEYW